jgi:hypothetical protein
MPSNVTIHYLTQGENLMKKALALLAVLAMALPATAQTLPQDPYGKPSSSPTAPVDAPSSGGTTAPVSPSSPSSSPSPTGSGAPLSPSGTTSSDKPATSADPSVTSTPAPADKPANSSSDSAGTMTKPASSDSAGTMTKPEEKAQTTGEAPAGEKPSGKQYRARQIPATPPAPVAPSS